MGLNLSFPEPTPERFVVCVLVGGGGGVGGAPNIAIFWYEIEVVEKNFLVVNLKVCHSHPIPILSLRTKLHIYSCLFPNIISCKELK